VLIGGPAGDHWSRRIVLLLGAALYALGLGGLSLAPTWPLAILAMAITGMGGGIVDSGFNALANDIASPARHAAEQSMLHSFYGVGALIGPLVIGAFLAMGAGWQPSYGAAGLAALVLVALLARLRLAPRPVRSEEVSVRAVLALAANQLVIVLALLIGLSVGAEVLVGDWAATYLQRIQHLEKAAAAASVGIYWGGLLVGRLLSALASSRYSARELLLGASAISVIGSLGLTLAPNTLLALLLLAICGLGYAALFPLVIAVAGEAFPEATGSVAGLLVGAASLAGAAFPAASGFLVQFADARIAVALSVPATVGTLLLAAILHRSGHGTPS
jgi:fucose permease